MSCQCYDATLRAYRELRALGENESHAYTAAVQVFRHYHPEKPKLDAFQEVADWLDQQDEAAA